MFRTYTRSLGDIFDLMGSAFAVSMAVRDHRPARAAELRRLGESESFGRINRR